ncbi:hydroxydechloroatrazine ethylaminohydrolase [Acetobacter nitrogenifigens DSM 23921 = NBRC 105050]|uniref:8-oxoguanine deaminase n=1 Tax=Acetobacter nitrogenifigens DSM 23921 = NBRC 105050 TaxID=1120919 RepID=A0A511X6K2_9PROT|nr:8-oxoguanine deaminase [Acetobacter nitrogenifigens]GBQ99032.1 hydroxydechloroatrazine ethylaminohydrolase [Acetobacter nitrogenifigens DSM 23921 = NBRC 105050]GEN58569.1 8-oxoguanine deaminase [Acetobacter nitrogenifigens DSM 23921 = NBRC 105050]
MTKTVLLSNAYVATMDGQRRELPGGWVLVTDNQITAVGAATDPEPEASERIDLAGHVLLPGLINTHHHMYQTLTRAVPEAQDVSLFGWLRALYPIWARLTPEMIRASTRTAMAELLLSGCTTSSDHLYLFPNGARLDDQIEAAEDMGMRFHAARGSMSVGESDGGLPPDSLVEDERSILADTQRVIERWHDASRFSMRRVVVAPCSPFSVSEGLMRDAASLARATGTTLHTHLAENDSDVSYSLEKFGKTPAHYAEDLGWLGADVWHAHCVKLDQDGISRFAATRTGVAHCPCSNMRLGSGIAPVRVMRAAGVPVALGVDGSASNDGGHMLGEARQAMLLGRVLDQTNGPLLGAREVLEIATRGGAEVLGRDDVGTIEPGMAADLAAFDISGIEHAGAQCDPLAALLFCSPVRAALTMVNGRVLVRGGVLLVTDERRLVADHNRLALDLING